MRPLSRAPRMPARRGWPGLRKASLNSAPRMEDAVSLCRIDTVLPLALLMTFAAAQAQIQTFPQGVPPGADPQTGARPGNEIGTGSSLPRSDTSSNIAPSDTHSVLAPNLPTPTIGENARIRDYLVAARSALAAGRTGEAQQALEMAETRRLDRSVPLFQTTAPIVDAQVTRIESALHTLASGDRMGAMRIIDDAIAHAGDGGGM